MSTQTQPAPTAIPLMQIVAGFWASKTLAAAVELDLFTKLSGTGLSDRIETYRGDFFNEELPKGSDVILLSMILHDWTPEKNRAILRKCFDALPSGGAVIVSELMMDDDKAGPVPAALMSLNMLIETEGRNYTWSDYTGWLEEMGFVEIKRIQVQSHGANGLLIGHKP